MLELNQRWTYDEIAECMGYESVASVFNIVRGAEPSHRKGEALWALYVETFDRRPRLKPLKLQSSERLVTT